MTRTDDPETVVVVNPASGSGDHVEPISRRASERGDTLEFTEEVGDAVDLARAAAERGASTVVAAGGDGTVNEVTRGLDRADALDEVTLGVIPVGTGNNFAGNLGITGIDHAFDVLDRGERRRIDLGRANGHLFVNSCVGGLTAESSDETSPELKSRFGVLAYVITTLRSYVEFEPPEMTVEVYEDGTTTTAWEGTPVVVFAGNARRIAPVGDSQADVEDGLLDVTIVEDASAIELVEDTVAERLFGDGSERLFGDGSEYVTHVLAPAIEVAVEAPDTTWFSLDGEMVEERTLSVSTQPSTVRVAVGEGYTSDPEGRRSGQVTGVDDDPGQ